MTFIGLKITRKIYGKIFGFKKKFFFNDKPPQYIGQKGSDLIKNLLMAEKPCMIARFGSTELDCINTYKNKNKNLIERHIKYINGSIDNYEWSEEIKHRMSNNAGFFPISDNKLEDFSKLMIKEMKNVDVLGSWLFQENNFSNELKKVKKVHLEDLVPFNHENPWSYALKNKVVLVVHPFVESINSQYLRRDLLFKDKHVLPDFKLITYKPVQSFLGNHENLDYKDWFEALEKMREDI